MIEPPDAPLGFAALPAELRARIGAELAPGERLLWANPAGPKPEAALLRPMKPGLIGIAGSILGSSLIWVKKDRFDHPAHGVGWLAGLGIAAVIASLIAFFVMLGAWQQRRINRRPDRRQTYALTNRRILIWEPPDRVRGVEVVTIEPQSVRSVHRLEYPDGSGEVRISFIAENRDFGTSLPCSLVGIPDVRRVEALTRLVLIGRNDRDISTFQRGRIAPDPFQDLHEPEEPF